MPAAVTEEKRSADDRNYYADDVASILGVSKEHAYKLIRELNAELNKQGFFTIKGRVPKEYFHRRYCSPENTKARQRGRKAAQGA